MEIVKSGKDALDGVIQGLRLGDNVVWQVDTLEDYCFFVKPFAEQAQKDRRRCVYFRFAPHPPVLGPESGFKVYEVDPGSGFDSFSSEVHRIIESEGREVFYVFDNLSALAVEWATDELVANFFKVTCPFLFELDTVAYFALTRGKHSGAAVARIRDTTQVLIDVFHVDGRRYVHPLKVWARYSARMFLPHLENEGEWTAVFQSGDAAAVSAVARRHPLQETADSIAPWESVFRRLARYRESEAQETDSEVAALKEEFCHMVIGVHPQFVRLVDRYLTVDDLIGIRSRMIGSGRIGGKSAGMLLARKILLEHRGEIDFSRVIESHDSFFLGSDVFFTFLVNNDLFRLRLQLSRSSQISREDFEDVERRFLAGKFSPEVMEKFRNILDYYGQAPIIVRSSSLLEDSYGNAFAGKYRSEFCTNQGSPEDRLEAFSRAVKLIYASAINPDALSYRRRRGLGDSDEQMAILIMRVSGMPFGKYFFPTLAGVAFSRNLYAWNDRIDPRRGLIRLVFGLGTRAVNRVGGDYPRMVSVSHPELRPEIGVKVAKYSQREMDALDLESNDFVTVPVTEVLSDKEFPDLHLFVSLLRDGGLYDPVGGDVDRASPGMVLTFNRLIRETNLVKTIGYMLGVLEDAYGHPVDTEFTAHVDPSGRAMVNLLQCRPLWVPGQKGPVRMPENVSGDRVLFRASRFINGGEVRNIRYIIYIDPTWYAAVKTVERKKSVARVVARLNAHPWIAAQQALLIGPGRWGSSNIQLGVNVGYADIDHAAVLVECAREEAGQVPEVSYGTHFFQDLVEQQIIYLPVFPNDEASQFNEQFFAGAPNILHRMLPDADSFEDVIKVIHVPSAAGGLHANVVADPESRQAICFLE